MLALAWWGAAYLIGGLSGAIWWFGDLTRPAAPAIRQYFSVCRCGMIWSGARLFHGLPGHWVAMLFGAAFWLMACFVPAFAKSAASRILSAGLSWPRTRS